MEVNTAEQKRLSPVAEKCESGLNRRAGREQFSKMPPV